MRKTLIPVLSLLLALMFTFGGHSKATILNDFDPPMKSETNTAAYAYQYSVNTIAMNGISFKLYPQAKQEAPSVASFTYNRSAYSISVLIVPDGMDPSSLIRNITEYNGIIDGNYSLLSSFARGIDFADSFPQYRKINTICLILDDYFDHTLSDYERGGLNSDHIKFPDWYAGCYALDNGKTIIDESDESGTDVEQFKLCIQIVKGKEAQAEELKNRLKAFEDYIVYKTVDFSFTQCSEIATDALVPYLKSNGVQNSVAHPDVIQNAIYCYIYHEYYNNAFALVKEIANATGCAVTVNMQLISGTVE